MATRKRILPTVFIDVGASTGLKCLRWAKKFPKARIYAIEPLPKYFEILKAKTSKYPNIRCFNFALSTSTAKSANFYVSKDKSCSSLLPFVRANMKHWKPPPGRVHFQTDHIIKVPTKTLAQFCREQRIKVIDFLKIDAQGHDLEICKSLGKMIPMTREILLEVQVTPFELYKGQSKKSDVLAFMSKNKFSLHKKKPWSFGQEENLWFTNDKYANRVGNRFWHLH